MFGIAKKAWNKSLKRKVTTEDDGVALEEFVPEYPVALEDFKEIVTKLTMNQVSELKTTASTTKPNVKILRSFHNILGCNMDQFKRGNSSWSTERLQKSFTIARTQVLDLCNARLHNLPSETQVQTINGKPFWKQHTWCKTLV